MAQFIPITTGPRNPRDAVASEHSRPLLRTNIAWTFVGQVTHAASQLAILCVLARLGTETAVGEYSLALAVTTPIFMVFNLHLRVVQATDQEHQFQLPDLMGTANILSGSSGRGGLGRISGFVEPDPGDILPGLWASRGVDFRVIVRRISASRKYAVHFSLQHHSRHLRCLGVLGVLFADP